MGLGRVVDFGGTSSIGPDRVRAQRQPRTVTTSATALTTVAAATLQPMRRSARAVGRLTTIAVVAMIKPALPTTTCWPRKAAPIVVTSRGKVTVVAQAAGPIGCLCASDHTTGVMAPKPAH